mgnify:CR=1 FL=1
MNTTKIRSQFPIFNTDSSLVFLDNASTTQILDSAQRAQASYDKKYRSNVHRGFYPIAKQATKKFEQSREEVANFLGADKEEVVFTSGTTESINIAAKGLQGKINKNDNIVITKLEHHSNIVTFQQLAETVGCELRFIKLDENFQLDYKQASEIVDEDTKILSFSLLSNAIGVKTKAAKLIELANQVDAYTLVDAAQAPTKMKLDINGLSCDLLALSGHKMFGPTGIGVLYGNKSLLREMQPSKFGGEMIEQVKDRSSSWAEIPDKFEGGTPNISGAIGLKPAVEFLDNLSFEKINRHIEDMSRYLYDKLEKIDKVNIIGRKQDLTHGITSFTIEDIHAHDIADILAKENISVRAGHHCAQPLMEEIDETATTRVSLSVYNDKEDIDKLIKGVDKVINTFSL